MKVGIDTNFLINLFRDGPNLTADQADLQRRARILFRKLIDEDHDILCPTVVGSEWMAGVAPSNHPAMLTELEKTFVLVSLDPPAMSLAARLWRDGRTLPKDEQPTRAILKADTYVVATLASAGAKRFYSNDAGARRLASSLGIVSFDYPQRAENLFADFDPDGTS